MNKSSFAAEQEPPLFEGELAEHFAPDGALRDIYVLDTTDSDWRKFLKALANSEFRFEATGFDGTPAKLPKSFADACDENEGVRYLLKIFVGNIQVNCHFFTDEEIELDIAPREISDGAQFAKLYDFLAWLSEAVKRQVILTHENTPDRVILAVGSD